MSENRRGVLFRGKPTRRARRQEQTEGESLRSRPRDQRSRDGERGGARDDRKSWQLLDPGIPKRGVGHDPALHQQLAAAGIVTAERQGRHVFYEMDASAVAERLQGILSITRQLETAMGATPVR